MSRRDALRSLREKRQNEETARRLGGLISTPFYHLKGRVPEALPAPPTDAQWHRYRRRVARDIVLGHRVSTVLEPLASPLTGKPRFETMVFPPDSYQVLYSSRCATYRQALRQHRRAIHWLHCAVKEGLV